MYAGIAGMLNGGLVGYIAAQAGYSWWSSILLAGLSTMIMVAGVC